MNGKLLSAVVFGLVVVASLSPAAGAIGVNELRELLKVKSIDGLRAVCGSPKLPVDFIKQAYDKIFLVYSDDPTMTERTEQNYKAFIYALEHPENPNYSKAIQAHSDAVCGAIESFYQRVEASLSTEEKAKQTLREIRIMNGIE